MTSSSVPATATVVDFICLFTHDLKRKQKRWQDGVLKYHTFNKRVMVYNDRSHFIGDAHWQGGGDLEPGDEFELDRGSAIVQVSDCTGQREQDLTELLDKRAKEVEKRRSNAGTRTPGSTAAIAHTPRNDPNAPHFQLRHRPLNDLVGGAPRIGRAVISPHSPYEVRKLAESPVQQHDSPSEDARPSKRRRQEESPPSKMGHARALFGTTLTLTPFSSSVSTARSQALPVKTTMKPRNMSTSTRTDLPNAPKRTDQSPEPPPCSSGPEELEIRAPHQPAPRRVFTQRASLRELLAGNEQNWNEDHLRPRETMLRNHTHASKKARPFPSHNQDSVVSLPTHETQQSKRLKNALQTSLCTTVARQESGMDKLSKHPASATANIEMRDSGRSRKQSAETNDDAFLSWLAQSEGTSGHQIPASPTDAHHPRLKQCRNGKGSTDQKTMKQMNHKVAQEIIQIDEDGQRQPPYEVAQTRPQNTIPKPLRKNSATTLETHGTKRPLSTDKALAGSAEPPPAKEPRTELRIRSRQRRGLLMVAQKKQGDGAGSLERSLPSSSAAESGAHIAVCPVVPSVPSSEEAEIAPDNTRGIDPSPLAFKGKDPDGLLDYSSPFQGPCIESASNFDSVVAEEALNHESSESLKSLRGLADARPVDGDEASDSVVSEEDRGSVTPPRRANPTRRTRASVAQVVLSDDEKEIAARIPPSEADDSDDQDVNSSTDTEPTRKRQPKIKPKTKPETSSGPRITKMSRKSVKSKEIIGFAMPAEDFPPAGFGIGDFGQTKFVTTEDMNKVTENASHGGQLALKSPASATLTAHLPEPARPLSEDQPQKKPMEEKQAQEEQSQPEQAPHQLQIKQPPRIPNPATRGKKAARKQDAAGLPPQAPTQSEPSASSHIVPANPTHRANPTRDTPQSQLPGFCKANGGPWSRHAEDLLGMTRPSKAPPRQ